MRNKTYAVICNGQNMIHGQDTVFAKEIAQIKNIRASLYKCEEYKNM